MPETDAFAIVFDAFARGFAPDPRLSVSEWADTHRMLPSEVAAEHGRWSTARTPYLREIMDAFTPQVDVQDIVVMKGSQIGATEAMVNCVGWVIGQVPGPALYVMPTVDLAELLSRQRIESMIRDSPQLDERVAPERSRDKANTLLVKQFRGGVLRLGGANSAASLRSMSVRFLLCDEVDEYPSNVEGQGDPIKLLERRTAGFANRKRVFASTPTIEGRSRIAELFAAGDQRRFFVPCPHCGAFQTIDWKRIKFEPNEPATAMLACESCGVLIEERSKQQMLPAGEWRPTAKSSDPLLRSYHISALYSPFGMYSWREAVASFLDAKRRGQDALKVWVNHVLGETFKERGDAPDWHRLFERRETWTIGTIPARACVLTAGVDVQKDRLELVVRAWAPAESWTIDRVVIAGDVVTAAPWTALRVALDREYPHELGSVLRIYAAAIDTGYETATCCAWIRAQGIGRIFAVRGTEGAGAVIETPRAVDVTTNGKRVSRGLRVWPVAGNVAKHELYAQLRLNAPTSSDEPFPPGYVHFPQFDEEFFRQLTAEQVVVHMVRGFPKYRWEKLDHDRNEVLDCHVYARAAAAIVGIDRMSADQWTKLASSRDAVGVHAQPKARPNTPPREGGGYLGRWRE